MFAKLFTLSILLGSQHVIGAPLERREAGADFGSCSTPEITFGAGIEGRKETSFIPTDTKSFNHGSAQNINIITQFICDTLTNSCKANQAAKDECTQAQAAASAATAKTGAQADAFNSVFGIKTNFNAVQPLDDQGNPVGGDTTGAAAGGSAGNASGAGGAAAGGAAAGNVTDTGAASGGAAAGGAAAGGAAAGGAAGAAGADFGSCSTPEITFGAGIEGRKETSFIPTDTKSFNHGSAQNINIITQFICDTLTNSCKANQAAKDECTQAQAAASAATAKTGAQADAFNGVFGITTNFNAVQPLDDQGNPVGAAGGAAAGSASGAGAGAGAATGGAAAGNATGSGAASGTGAGAASGGAGAASGGAGAGAAAGGANTGVAAGAAASGGNLQKFTGALGGVTAPAVTAGGSKGFQTDNSDFVNLGAALQRSCAVQHNQCADAANSKAAANVSVADCDAQETQCNAAAA